MMLLLLAAAAAGPKKTNKQSAVLQTVSHYSFKNGTNLE
jgi:hypothetical protein